jgi:hypothetical protein
MGKSPALAAPDALPQGPPFLCFVHRVWTQPFFHHPGCNSVNRGLLEHTVATVTSDVIVPTVTLCTIVAFDSIIAFMPLVALPSLPMMCREEHFWHFSVLQRLHLSNHVILSSHPCLGLLSALFLSGFSTNILYATCPTYLILPDLIIRLTLGQEYKL